LQINSTKRLAHYLLVEKPHHIGFERSTSCFQLRTICGTCRGQNFAQVSATNFCRGQGTTFSVLWLRLLNERQQRDLSPSFRHSLLPKVAHFPSADRTWRFHLPCMWLRWRW